MGGNSFSDGRSGPGHVDRASSLQTAFGLYAAAALGAGVAVRAGVLPAALVLAVGAIGAVAAKGFRRPRRISSVWTIRRRLTVLALLVLTGTQRYAANSAKLAAFVEPEDGAPVSVSGTVIRPCVTRTYGAQPGRWSSSFDLHAPSFPAVIRIVASVPLADIRGGDRITVRGVYVKAVRSLTTHARATATIRVDHLENVEVGPEDGSRWPRLLGSLREVLYQLTAEVYHDDQTRGYVLSLLLGDRRLLHRDSRLALRDTGTFHFLAISGLHVGFLMLVVLRIPLPKHLQTPGRTAFLVAFALVTGCQPPVLRATLLFLGDLLARSAGRSPSSLNVLGWSAVALLAWNPLLLFDVGFQLSFAAALTIVTWGRRLRDVTPARVLRADGSRRRAQHRRAAAAAWPVATVVAAHRALWSLAAVSIAALLGTAPLLLHHFQRLHPLAPLWNILAYPFTVITLAASLAGLLLGAVHPSLAAPVADLVEFLVATLVDALTLAREVPGSTLFLPPPRATVVSAFYLCLALSFCTRPRFALAAAAIFAAGLGVSGWIGRPPHVNLDTIQRGQASATLLATPDLTLLLDNGTLNQVQFDVSQPAQQMARSGRTRLDAIVLRRLNATAASNIAQLSRVVAIDAVWVPARPTRTHRRSVEQLRRRGVSVQSIRRGVSWRHSDESSPLVVAHLPRERSLSRQESTILLSFESLGIVYLDGAISKGLAAQLARSEFAATSVLLALPDFCSKDSHVLLLDRMTPDAIVLLDGPIEVSSEFRRVCQRRRIRVLATSHALPLEIDGWLRYSRR